MRSVRAMATAILNGSRLPDEMRYVALAGRNLLLDGLHLSLVGKHLSRNDVCVERDGLKAGRANLDVVASWFQTHRLRRRTEIRYATDIRAVDDHRRRRGRDVETDPAGGRPGL